MKSGVSQRCARSILVHTSHYSRLEKIIDYTACHPRKTTTYILHVVPITTHTHDRRKSSIKRETNTKKEDKGKKSQESEKRKRKGKKRKTRKTKIQDKNRKQGKEKRKNVILKTALGS